jgi:hypothetical protein
MPPSLPPLAFRGFRPRAPPEALPYSILRGLSRPREAALRLAPVRSGGAAHRARGAAIAAGKAWPPAGDAGGHAPELAAHQCFCMAYPL